GLSLPLPLAERALTPVCDELWEGWGGGSIGIPLPRLPPPRPSPANGGGGATPRPPPHHHPQSPHPRGGPPTPPPPLPCRARADDPDDGHRRRRVFALPVQLAGARLLRHGREPAPRVRVQRHGGDVLRPPSHRHRPDRHVRRSARDRGAGAHRRRAVGAV